MCFMYFSCFFDALYSCTDLEFQFLNKTTEACETLSSMRLHEKPYSNALHELNYYIGLQLIKLNFSNILRISAIRDYFAQIEHQAVKKFRIFDNCRVHNSSIHLEQSRALDSTDP